MAPRKSDQNRRNQSDEGGNISSPPTESSTWTKREMREAEPCPLPEVDENADEAERARRSRKKSEHGGRPGE